MKQRLISAGVAIVIVLPFLLLGGTAFNIFITLVGLVGMWELLRLKDIPKTMKIVTYILYVLLTIFSYGADINNILVFVSVLALFLPIVLYHKDDVYNCEDALFLLGSVILLSIAFRNFIYIRSIGLNTLLYLLSITIITDSFAYIMGSKFGKKKLAPSISPKKSVEGSIYGSLFGTIISTILYVLLVNKMNVFLVVFITLILSIVGQFGDLVFSSIKRHFKIKDFSNIMPGHGGILDRLDSIIFVVLTYIIIISIL